ncbi:MAG: serine/threonine protein kinase [Myxococcales bacterium]|nr:serine/threonine protein kinase [Myxococcales bacterium]
MNRNTLVIALALTTTLLGTGCSKGFDIKTPDGFAELDTNDDFRYRATSANGIVLAVRREKNDPKGGLDFWAQAIENELELRGYGNPKVQAVEAKNGTAGKQFRYETTRGGRPNVLWVTVFVSGDRVVVVESGGDKDHFRQVEKQVDAAIRAVEVG